MSIIRIDLLDIVGRSVPGRLVFRPLNTPFVDAGHGLRVSASRSLDTEEDGRGEISLAGGNYEVLVWGRGEEFLDRLTIGVPDDAATYPLTALIDGGVTPPVPPVYQGSPGSQIFSGNRAPLPGEGANGDYWFNTVTRALFGPKSGGAWPGGTVLLKGDQGDAGADGEDGRAVELQKSATHIQWRYAGDLSWSDLIALADLRGVDGEDGADGTDGREVELQKSATHIQWRYTGGAWGNLVALADLTGARGDDGEAATITIGTVTTGAPGSSVSFTNVGTAHAAVIDVSIPRGDKGAIGNTGPLNEFEYIALSGTNMDCVRDRIFSKSISANTSFTFSSMSDGRIVILKLTAIGAVSPSWPAGIEWPGGILPIHAPSSKVWYQFAMAEGGIVAGFAVPVGVPA